MMDEGVKKTSKVFTTDDIREQARNWSLAGDAGLLAHLEQFSEKICSKTQDTTSKLNELVESYEEIHKKIDNVTNQFLALQNCQFVENRVYDEETPTEENIKEKVLDDSERERLLLQQYKEAVNIGVTLLDTHFEAVELPLCSDSDDEDEEVTSGNTSLMWKPKNPYAGKKFPCLIGSSEWWEDDKVGLGEPEESSIAEKEESDAESDLDMERTSGKEIHVSSSSSLENEKLIVKKQKPLYESSEDLFGLDKNSIFKASESDIFGVTGSDSSFRKREISTDKDDEQDILPNAVNELSNDKPVETTSLKTDEPNKPKKVDNDFTRELAAKLGGFAKGDAGTSPPVDKSFKESPPEPRVNRSSNLFDDDDDDDDDDDNNDLFSGKMKENPVIDNMFSDSENNANLFGGSNQLFDGSESDLFNSDDLVKSKTNSKHDDKSDLSSSVKTAAKKNLFPFGNGTTGLFGDCDIDNLENEDDDNSLFGSTSPMKNKISSRSPEGEENLFSDTISPLVDKTMKTDNVGKSKGLFDDDDDDGSDIFEVSKPKGHSSHFSGLENCEDTDNLFSSEFKGKKVGLLEESGVSSGSLPFESKSESSSNHRKTQNQDSTMNRQVAGDNQERLFGEIVKDLTDEKKETPSKYGLPSFDQLDEDSSLFLDKPKAPDATSISSSRSSLFDDVPAFKTRLASVFEKDKINRVDDDLFNSSDTSVFAEGLSATKTDENDLFSSSKVPKIIKGNGKSSLFDDFDDDDDTNLFQNTKKPKDIPSMDSALDKVQPPTIGVASVKTLKTLSDDLFDEDFMSLSKKTEGEENLFNEATKSVSEDDIFAANSFLNGLDAEADDLFGKVGILGPKQTEKEQTKKVVGKSKSQSDVSDAIKKLEEKKEKTSSATTRVKTIEEKSLFADNEDLFGDDIASVDPVKSKPKPPDSLSLKKESGILEPGGKGKIVGKLNIPKSLKTQLEASVKQVSSDIGSHIGLRKSTNQITADVKSQDESDKPYEPPSNLLKCPSKDRVKIPGRRRPQSRRARQEAIRNSGSNFLDADNPVPENSDSVSSKTNSTNNSVDISSKIMIVTTEKDSMPSPEFQIPKSHPLSPSTDEEDIFNVPGLDSNFEKEDHSLFKGDLFEPKIETINTDNSLFGDGPVLSPLGGKIDNDDDDDDDDLFQSPRKTKIDEIDEAKKDKILPFTSCLDKPQSKEKKSDGIFGFDDRDSSDGFGDDDDDDDEDSLFKSKSSAGGIRGKKSQDFLSTSKAFMQGMKTSLFDKDFVRSGPEEDDDDDDDDDLFVKGSGKESKVAPLTAEKITKVGNEKSEKSETNVKGTVASTNVPFVDPLGLMSKEDDS